MQEESWKENEAEKWPDWVMQECWSGVKMQLAFEGANLEDCTKNATSPSLQP